MPKIPVDHLDYAKLLTDLMDKYGLNTIYRQAYFLGQVAWESGDLRYMREEWNPEKVPQQLKYERNFDHPWPHTPEDKTNRLAYRLGNFSGSDGYAFRGFGPLQVTGRNNALAVSQYLFGDDQLVHNTHALNNPEVGFGAAFWYWNDRRLNEKADVKDYKGITLAINGACTDGPPSHHLKRVECMERAFVVLS
jgi:putative chitinase